MIDGKKIVALCTYRIYESQEFSFLRELNRQLQKSNCCLFIFALNSEIGLGASEKAEQEVFDLIPYDKTDAVVIMDEKLKSRELVKSIIKKATDANVPSIVVDGDYDNVSVVKYDYARGFETVVRHIIEDHKVKKPHFMAGKRNNIFSDERIEVFKKVLAQNGIPFDDSMISYGEFWSLPCRAATSELLKRKELPDAVICANDIMAINVCDVMREAGIRVPEDIIVSGFDGIEEAFLATPGITTAICDSTLLAGAVHRAILKIFGGESIVKEFIVPGFIHNESCGCERYDHSQAATVNGFNNGFYHYEDDIHILQNMTSKIMTGRDLYDSIDYLKENLAKHVVVVAEKSCFDLESNFFYEDVEKGAKLVVFDSYDKGHDTYPYDPDEFVPHLSELMKDGYPLIFNGLEYMDKCPGFVCYSYPRVDLVDFNQTMNLTNCFSMSLGGFVVHKYQNYLREKLREMYQNDALTGLYNRLAFISKMEEKMRDSKCIGQKATVIVMDLNGLKLINDGLGHLAGDNAIKATAESLKKACPDNALCVRTGGDEMLAFIVGDCDLDKITKDITEHLKISSRELGFTVTASIGTYETVFDNSINMNKIIGIADERMYEMKRKMKKQNV